MRVGHAYNSYTRKVEAGGSEFEVILNQPVWNQHGHLGTYLKNTQNKITYFIRLVILLSGREHV